MVKKLTFSVISNILKIASAIIMVVTLVAVPFAPAIDLVSGSVVKSYNPAFSFMFTGKIYTGNVGFKVKSVSPVTLIAYILIFISLVLIVVSFSFKKKKVTTEKCLTLAASTILIVAAIMTFCAQKEIATILADSILKSHSDAVTKTIIENSSLNFGIWGIGFFALFASLHSFTSLIFDGTFDKVRSKIGII